MVTPAHFSDEMLNSIGRATSAWVSYRHVVGRSGYFSEKSLAEPIGDYLVSRCGNWKTQSEFRHPKLNLGAKSGRPKQIDFVAMQGTALKFALETKWLPTTKSLVLEDIARLVTLKSDGNEARNIYRALMICGTHTNFNAMFATKKQRGRPGTNLDTFLAHKTEGYLIRKVDDKISGDLWKFWEEKFQSATGYKSASPFTSKLVGIHKVNDFTTAVWSIQLKKGRRAAIDV